MLPSTTKTDITLVLSVNGIKYMHVTHFIRAIRIDGTVCYHSNFKLTTV